MKKSGLAVIGIVLTGAAVAILNGQTHPADDSNYMRTIAHVFNDRREACYAATSCPNLDELMELFAHWTG